MSDTDLREQKALRDFYSQMKISDARSARILARATEKREALPRARTWRSALAGAALATSIIGVSALALALHRGSGPPPDAPAASGPGVNRIQGSLPSPRFASAMACGATPAYCLLFGGSGPTGELGDTWKWDGVSWRQLDLIARPTPRAWAAMGYDRVTGRMVLFGGSLSATTAGANSLLADTWTFDGSEWSMADTHGGPPARDAAALATAPDGHVVLFGGIVEGRGSTFLDDTWTWSGSQWNRQTTTVMPSARGHSAAALDARDGVVTLYGGVGRGGAVSDTWLWDGHGWMPETATGPTSSSGRMAEGPDGPVLFGGVTGSGLPTAELWLYQHGRWVAVHADPSPSVRTDSAFAYDASRQVFIMMDGNAGSRSGAYLSDMWVYDGTHWRQQILAP